MAAYHFQAKMVSFGKGQSAVAKAAYNSRTVLVNERDRRLTHDYTGAGEVAFSGIFAPKNAPEWAHDRAQLWNHAEAAETYWNGAPARNLILALPWEISQKAREQMTTEFFRDQFMRKGMVADVNMHRPDEKGDERNWHVHAMITTREIGPNGFAEHKTGLSRDVWDDPATLAAWKDKWAELGSRMLEKEGFHIEAGRFRHGHKSFYEQRVAALDRGDIEWADHCAGREASKHLGPNAAKMQRDGKMSDLGALNEATKGRNNERAALRNELAQITAEIIDLDAERKARQSEKVSPEVAAFRQAGEAVSDRLGTTDSGAEKPLDPAHVLDQLTERRATFTFADLARHTKELLPDTDARAAFMTSILARPDVVTLRDEQETAVTRYTTRAVLDEERHIKAVAGRMDDSADHGLSKAAVDTALDRNSFLDTEQRDALHWATRDNGFAIIAGEAGTGKSATMGAIRQAYELGGYNVIGTAWTNAVVRDMKRDGFDNAGTLAGELLKQSSGRGQWDSRTVVMVDEAGMLSSRSLDALLSHAERAGAKVILAGDDRQLGSIERGGMFAHLQGIHDAAELHTVRRVSDLDQKTAFNRMHSGDFRAALDVFDKQGAIRWGNTAEDAKAALVEQWGKDSAADPTKSRFAFAYTNAEVSELNARIRDLRRERGELGDDHVLPTKTGPEAFAVGDRVQFNGNAKDRDQRTAGLYNGAAGTLIDIDGTRVTVALDQAKGADAQTVSFTVGDNAEAGEFNAIRHGYAGTIYKGQGKTLDQTYLLHSDQWRSASAYVALSRHRDTVTLFAAKEDGPWMAQSGGYRVLDERSKILAEESYAGWTEGRPELAKRHDLEDYVSYVQGKWAEEQKFSPLGRMAKRMGREDEGRAASDFTAELGPHTTLADVIGPKPQGPLPVYQSEPVNDRPISATAGEIRLAYVLSASAESFAEGLEQRGIHLATISEAEAAASERNALFAKALGRYAPEYRTGEIVAVNNFGSVYGLTERTTGDTREEIAAYLADVDRQALSNVTDTRDAIREANRAEFIEQLAEDRTANRIEQRIADIIDDARVLTSSSQRGQVFAFETEMEGIYFARATTEDLAALKAEYATITDSPTVSRSATNIQEGEIVAVTMGGHLHRLNVAKVDQGMLDAMLTDAGQGQLDSIAEVRGDLSTAASERSELWATARADAQDRRDERASRENTAEGYSDAADRLQTAFDGMSKGAVLVMNMISGAVEKLTDFVASMFDGGDNSPAPTRSQVDAYRAQRAHREAMANIADALNLDQPISSTDLGNLSRSTLQGIKNKGDSYLRDLADEYAERERDRGRGLER